MRVMSEQTAVARLSNWCLAWILSTHWRNHWKAATSTYSVCRKLARYSPKMSISVQTSNFCNMVSKIRVGSLMSENMMLTSWARQKEIRGWLCFPAPVGKMCVFSAPNMRNMLPLLNMSRNIPAPPNLRFWTVLGMLDMGKSSWGAGS